MNLLTASTTFRSCLVPKALNRGIIKSGACPNSFCAPELTLPASAVVATTSKSSAISSRGQAESVAAAAPAIGPTASSAIAGHLVAAFARRIKFAAGTSTNRGPATATRVSSAGFKASADKPCSPSAATSTTSSGRGRRCSTGGRNRAATSFSKTPPSAIAVKTSAAVPPCARFMPFSSHLAIASAIFSAFSPTFAAARRACK
mmetsp:Transcript_103776/g.184086  ORF Transcript_103776/g.184086 Transcript_103776/m.184086 type:complete len:203 (-) Transcript_103776:349-957(-)